MMRSGAARIIPRRAASRRPCGRPGNQLPEPSLVVPAELTVPITVLNVLA